MRLEISRALGTELIQNPISLSGGNPGGFSRITPGSIDHQYLEILTSNSHPNLDGKQATIVPKFLSPTLACYQFETILVKSRLNQ